MQFTTRFGRVFHLDGLLLIVLISSLSINVFLGVTRNSALDSRQNPRELIAAGTKAPIFEGKTLAGEKVKLNYASDNRNTLLYVFSPTCHWCEKNQANIISIIKARPDLRIIGVAIGPVLDAAEAARQPFVEILQPTPATSIAYHLNGTPATLLISSSGLIVNAWAGAYGGSVAASVSQVLAVDLPGLTEQ